MGNSTSSILNIIKGSNITNSKNFGVIFNDTLDVDYLNEKNTELKKLVNNNRNIPNIKSTKKVFISNSEYLYLVKNFINYFNENNKNRMNYLRKSFGIKYLINDTHFLYFILFFCEFEDFERTSRAQNILFLSLNEKDKDFILEDSVIIARILGEWPTSDVLLGNEDEFGKKRFIDIFKDQPIRYVMDDNIIGNILSKKGYITDNYYERGFPPKKFRTENPRYYKNEKEKDVKIMIGDKCLDVKDNKLSFKKCNQTKSLFSFTEDNKLKYINDNQNNCVSFHKDGDISLSPCDTIDSCDTSNELQNCNTFKPRKYGGLEIVGKNRMCLDNDKTSTECYKVNKLKLI